MLQRQIRLMEKEKHAHTCTLVNLALLAEIFFKNKKNNPSDQHIFEKLCAFTLKRKQRENHTPCHKSETTTSL